MTIIIHMPTKMFNSALFCLVIFFAQGCSVKDEYTPQQITANRGSNFHPSFSPDGEYIVFDNDSSGHWEINSIKIDGGILYKITFGSQSSDHPSWFPDGNRIAFESERDTAAKEDIYIMNKDGSGQKRLTSSKGVDGASHVSPDNKSILFLSNRTGHYEIYVINTDGSNEKQITNDSFPKLSPVWSPDGKKIAYQFFDQKHWKIGVADLVLNRYAKLVDRDTVDYREPQWSPDGHELVFVSGPESNMDLYLMNADGSNQRRLTYTTLSESEVAWAPDGRSLVYVLGTGDDAEICTINPEGKGFKQLTSNHYREANPQWSPDSKSIVYAGVASGNLDIYLLRLKK